VTLGFARYPFPVGNPGLARGYLSTVFSIYKHLEAMPTVTLQDIPVMPEPLRSVQTFCHALNPPVTLHVGAPQWFRPLKNTKNVLFTMWETDTLPEDFLEGLRKADAWLVPSEHNKMVWAKYGLDAQVVPLGVHEAYTRVDPSRNKLKGPGGSEEPLNILFVGSQSPRKGWPVIAPAFAEAFGEMIPGANVQLIVKTIQNDPTKPKDVKLFMDGRVVIDTRDLEPAQMLGLYQFADVFLYPSLGEGFGLPPLEAMAAGALTVSTKNTGMADFFDEGVGYVIPQTIDAFVEYGAGPTPIKLPDPKHLAGILADVYKRWGTLEVESLRQSGTLRARGLTWTRTAERILDAVGLTPATKVA